MDNLRFRHLRRNLIVGVVLCLVLAGTAVASVKVADHATGGVTCGGACPAKTVYWAYITATGVPGSLSPGTTVSQTALGGVPAQVTHVGTGSWLVFFSGKDLSNCARMANLTSIRGSATVGQYNSANPDKAGIPVLTTDANGNPVDADFVVSAFCGGGLGSTNETGN